VTGQETRFVARKAVDLSDASQRQARPLSDWRFAKAYVLLAEPGAGKTRAFENEQREGGGEYVTARDFITLGLDRFKGRGPIYIDGLDEIRAGSATFRGPLDDIRRRLDELGCPAFRLSCREADWIGAVDQDALRAVAPRGELAVLHLEDLDDADIAQILLDLKVKDPAAFLAQANRHGIRALLGNPLLLLLMVSAVGRDASQWPESRTSIYRKACEQLCTEWNEQHRAEIRHRTPSVEQLMDDGGLLCSLCLLAGAAGFAREVSDTHGTYIPIDTLPRNLGIHDAELALSSKLFVAEGGIRIPRHRTIAEFLAAQAISRRIANGLPLGRVLSLMSGMDGGIVDPLRGLHAWLATHCKSERNPLIDRDPLSVVLYGDLRHFSTDEKESILRALDREAQRFPWFRKGQWQAEPFGALGTPDMAERFQTLLRSPDRSPAHQSLLECVLEAIEHGKPMPSIAGDLQAVVWDHSFFPRIRGAALDAWLKQAGVFGVSFRTLLDDIERGVVSDLDDELAGRLLHHLYPTVISPEEIFRFFHPPKAESLYGQYRDFWRRRLISITPREALGTLMEAWVDCRRPESDRHLDSMSNEISGSLLGAALSAHGDNTSVESLYRWLGVALDKYGSVRMHNREVQGVRRWLSARPSLLKALVAYGWSQLKPEGESGRRFFWRVEERILGAERPRDWYAWLLEQAAQTDQEDLARYCFDSAAHLAIYPRREFELSMEPVEAWVEQNRDKWPAAPEWLRNAWTVPLTHWEGEHARERQARKKEETAKRQQRREKLLQHLVSLPSGMGPPGLLHQLALAYEGRFSDIQGETPIERVMDFLSGTEEEARSAIGSFEEALKRQDLPSVEEILKTDLKGRSHYIRLACLLGATLAFRRDPAVVMAWPEALAAKLAAFWLTEGVGEEPGWYEALSAHRPALVAPVLERFAIQRLRKRGETHVPGLWQLAREERFANLARLVVPALIRAFPVRARDHHLRVLSGELIPAAVRHLSREDFAKLIAERLARRGMDIPQRIAYLVAGLTIEGIKYSRALLRLVGASEARAAHLGRAIEWQGNHRPQTAPLPAPVLSKLIELVAPFASPERPTGVHWVSDADRRREWVYHFVNQIAADPSEEASAEIERLASNPRLASWKSALQGAAFDQVRVRRQSTFRLASIEDVANVIANGAPANPQDLAVLVLHHLAAVEAQMRGDDTNALALFRRDDGKTPKSENECRDVLLPRVRAKLMPLGVGLEKESQAARGTRADLRAEFRQSGRRIAVPIEIKKEDHPDLWSAWRTQLRFYALDPDTEGVGIYLALWFGVSARPSPDGTRLTSAEALGTQLSESIPKEMRTKLHVAVLDLSFPVRA
jgi:hypothetical protein